MSSPGADGNGFPWIQKARTEFHVPLRRLATHSCQEAPSRRLSRSTAPVLHHDLEMNGSFDLRYYFTLSNEANKTAGIQPKRVGVTWEDLQVVVHGDKNCKVKSFSRELDRPSYFSIRHTSRHLTVGSFVCSWTT
jgi:ABC-transporter N-terminal